MLSTMSSRSTKGASKQRRENINGEISIIRDLLPIQEQVRSRLSQLQIMSLCKAYIGKSNLLNSLQETKFEDFHPFDFTQAIAGFLLITDMKGRIFYVSDNVTDYLSHSMVDVITQAESVYELIHSNDQQAFRTIYSLGDQSSQVEDQTFAFTCRMGMLKHPRRNPNFDRYKKMRIFGRKVIANDPSKRAYFVALCTPRLNPMMASDPSFVFDTMIFKSLHSMDMKFIGIDHNGEHHFGYSEKELSTKSWYEMIHPDDIETAINKHKELIQQVALEASCYLSIRVQSKAGDMICLQVIMKKESSLETNSEARIVCWNQVVCPNEMGADDKDDLLHQMNTISYLDQYCSSQNSDKNKLHFSGSVSSSSPSSSSSASLDLEKCTKEKRLDRSELMERLKRKMQKPEIEKMKRPRVDGGLGAKDFKISSSSTLDLMKLLDREGAPVPSLDQSGGFVFTAQYQPADFASTLAREHLLLQATSSDGGLGPFKFSSAEVPTMPTPESRPTWPPSPTSALGYCPANSPGSDDLNNQSFFPVGVGLPQLKQEVAVFQPADEKRFGFPELKPQEVDEFFQMEANFLADFIEFEQFEAVSSIEPFAQSFLQQLSAY